jgi:hypothetical protein
MIYSGIGFARDAVRVARRAGSITGPAISITSQILCNLGAFLVSMLTVLAIRTGRFAALFNAVMAIIVASAVWNLVNASSSAGNVMVCTGNVTVSATFRRRR